MNNACLPVCLQQYLTYPLHPYHFLSFSNAEQEKEDGLKPMLRKRSLGSLLT